MIDIEALNRSLFLRMNGSVDSAVWEIDAAIGIADGLIYLIPLVLVGMWVWGGRDRRSLAIKAFLVAMVGVGANQVIGLIWQHPRPFMLRLGHAWVTHVADSSFPSDHMTVFVGVGLTLLFGGATRFGVFILLTGLSVAWARVFLGLHFPLDMVGAVGVAGVIYAAMTPLWGKVGGHITDLAERVYRVIVLRVFHVDGIGR